MHNHVAKRIFRAMSLSLLSATAIQAAPQKLKPTGAKPKATQRKAAIPKPKKAKDMFVYVGTYTGKGSKGIYVYRLNPDGKLVFTQQTAETQSPSFLALAPSGHTLYAGNEVWNPDEKPGAGVSAFAVDASGGLKFLNRQSTGTGIPAYVAVAPDGKTLAVANYGGGSVASFPLDKEGKLGEQASFDQHVGSSINEGRQKEPHAHSIIFDASGRFAFAADLGVDRIYVYRVDSATGKLAPNDIPFAPVHAGAGPRHIALHASQKFAFVINELDATISTLSHDARTGALKELEHVSTLPADFTGSKSGADIHISPNGKFLYASNRGHDSIAIFSIDQSNGHLTSLGHQSTLGKTPRNFGIDPSGHYLLAANQDSNNIVVFRVDEKTGMLSPTGQTVEVPSPVSILFAP
jgi:6-phosphogluconolactonase